MGKIACKNKKCIFDICVWTGYALLIILFLNRIIRGIDTTDESFYATMAYRICNGNLLFEDMWEQCSTSAVFPAFLLRIYLLCSKGNVEGIILFFRLAFFICNLLVLPIVYMALRVYVEKIGAFLAASLILLYAPFHLYCFSYNHQADLLFIVTVSIWLIASEKNIKLFFLSGCVCACLAFVYPTMVFLCAIFVGWLYLLKKYVFNGWKYFMAGGLGCAAVILLILIFTVGITGILEGINGIMADPSYGATGLYISEKMKQTFNHLFAIFDVNTSPVIKIYILLLFFIGYYRKRFPKLKCVAALYPFIIYLQMTPAAQYMTYATGTYMFYLSVIAPFLLFFIDQNKDKFFKLICFMWLPSVMFYVVISISSYGGPGQAAQGLAGGAVVSMIGIVFILTENLAGGGRENTRSGLAPICISVFFMLSLIFEVRIFYSVVYREANVSDLTYRIEEGPYKGIYTTEDRKKYIEKMSVAMNRIQDKDESALVLYHSNFAYLMMESMPATPTTWGVYPHIDNQDVFFQYFSKQEDHIPDVIYIVDVPDDYNFDSQSEDSFQYCNSIRQYINDNYNLIEDIAIHQTGRIKKYQLMETKTEILNKLSKYKVGVSYGDGAYGLEKDENTTWSWFEKTGKLILTNITDKDLDIILRFTAYIPCVDKKSLFIESTESGELIYKVNREGMHIELNETLKPGDHVYEISTDADQFLVEMDKRDLFFALQDITVEVKQ